ncbi:Hypothetical predicted protein [Paramuricea clavata]|uniref:Uncharacterized protein n=1 Tax=Paramuricea clavata TaxID=317549 RepID=A0A6S7FRP5_PARCT|nr:Hypothetical predicted protein [Paramuricea clavata]
MEEKSQPVICSRSSLTFKGTTNQNEYNYTAIIVPTWSSIVYTSRNYDDGYEREDPTCNLPRITIHGKRGNKRTTLEILDVEMMETNIIFYVTC